MTLVAERYELGELVGEGGMGSVYRATHNVTGKRVALKLISHEVPLSDDALTRFRREARAAGVLDTEHIVQVFDSGVDPQSRRPYIAMELLEGESVKGALQRLGPLPPSVAMCIVSQACAGLAEAHRAGVIHRDIKPSNLFLTRVKDRLVVKVLDFGIAKLDPGLRDASDAEDLTHTGTLLGSPHYIAPEQIRAEGAVDHRADLWSLGVVLFEALTGRRPHESAKTMMELMFRTYMERVPGVRTLSPWVEPEDAAIVARAVELAPGDRYQDVGALRAAILERIGDDALAPDALKALPATHRVVVAADAVGDATAADTVASSDDAMRKQLASGTAMRADDIATSTDAVVSQSMSERPPPLVPVWRSLALVAGVVGILAIAWLALSGDDAEPVPGAAASEDRPTPSVPAEPRAETTTIEADGPVSAAPQSSTRVPVVRPATGATPPSSTKSADTPPTQRPPNSKTISKETGEFD